MVSVSSLAATAVVWPATGATGETHWLKKATNRQLSKAFRARCEEIGTEWLPTINPLGQSDGGFFPNAERNYD